MVTIMISWTKMKEISKGTSIKKIGVLTEKIGENLYKISDEQYLMANSLRHLPGEGKPEGPFIMSILWASSDGSARRAYFHDIEHDDGAILPPPPELLPHPAASRCGEIVEKLEEMGLSTTEEADYRVIPDGAFVHRVIDSEIAKYYFRSRKSMDDEPPFAIQWRLK